MDNKERFVKKPNLPEGCVTLCAVGKRYIDITASLIKLGVNVINLSASDVLPENVASHADMLILHTGNTDVIAEQTQESLIQNLTERGFCVKTSEEAVKSKYPGDVILNHAICGDYMFTRKASADKAVLKFVSDLGITMLDVKQGYAKCSTAVVDEKAIISDDDAICSVAKENGFDVLKVSKGDIRLPGAGYGFIGGCCGKLSKDIMAFTGDLKYHSDCKEIITFLRNYGISPEYLTNGQLIDIGGILPLKEK